MLAKRELTLLITSIMASGCFKGPGFLKQSGTEKATLIVQTVEKDGAVTGKIDAESKVTQTLEASEDSAISGSSVTFPPGALGIDADVTLEEGSDVLSNTAALDLGLEETGTLEAASAAVVVQADANVDPSAPFTLQIPVSGDAALRLQGLNYIVMYKAIIQNEGGKVVLGIIPSSQITLSNGNASFSISYFGSYQVIETDLVIAEAKTVDSSEPILTKASEKRLPPLVWENVAAEYLQAERKGTISASLSGADSIRCSLQVDQDKIAPFDQTRPVPNLGAADLSPLSATAHSLAARFECTDSMGRSSLSPWSTSLEIGALKISLGDSPGKLNPEAKKWNIRVSGPGVVSYLFATGKSRKKSCSSLSFSSSPTTIDIPITIKPAYEGILCVQGIDAHGHTDATVQSFPWKHAKKEPTETKDDDAATNEETSTTDSEENDQNNSPDLVSISIDYLGANVNTLDIGFNQTFNIKVFAHYADNSSTDVSSSADFDIDDIFFIDALDDDDALGDNSEIGFFAREIGNTHIDFSFENETISLSVQVKKTCEAPSSSTVFHSGDGSADKPFVICTTGHLANIDTDLDAHFILGQNIDLGNTPFNDPIGSGNAEFSGIFDGQGYHITGLHMDTTLNNVGIFASTSSESEIRNLKIVDGFFKGNDFVGAIAGINRGKISHVSVDAKVLGNNNVGIVAGKNQSGTMEDIHSEGFVQAATDAGGITGSNSDGGVIQRVFSSGFVKSPNTAGGIVGINSGSDIKDSLSAAILYDPAGSSKASIAGAKALTNNFLNNHYLSYPGGGTNCYATDACGLAPQSSFSNYFRIEEEPSATWATASSELWSMDELRPPKLLVDLEPISFKSIYQDGRKIGQTDQSAVNVKGFCGIKDGPIIYFVTGDNDQFLEGSTSCNRGAWEITFDVSSFPDGPITLETIIKPGYRPSHSITLELEKEASFCVANTGAPFAGGDGSLSSPHLICDAAQFLSLDSGYASSDHFKLMNNIDLSTLADPIGGIGTCGTSGTGAFCSHLDGNGFRVTDYNLPAGAGDTGLFAKLASGSTVENLTIENAVISTTGDFAGLLAGISHGQINNVVASGQVKSMGTDPVNYLGGIIGKQSGGNLNHVSFLGSVKNSSTGQKTGGIAGSLDTASVALAERFFVTGNVVGSAFTGGIAGAVSGASGWTGSEWAFQGNLTSLAGANAGDSGGLVGTLATNHTLTASYARGMIVGFKTGDHSGGLVGQLDTGATISDSYAAMVVLGDSAGGMVGTAHGDMERVAALFGLVAGNQSTGGLAAVGHSACDISDSVSLTTVAVASGSEVGGVFGKDYGPSASAVHWWHDDHPHHNPEIEDAANAAKSGVVKAPLPTFTSPTLYNTTLSWDDTIWELNEYLPRLQWENE